MRSSKGAVLALIVLPFLFAFGPSSCSKTDTTPVNWPAVVQCAANELDIVGEITQVLIADTGKGELSAEGKQKLEELARTHTAAAVLCIVDRLVKDWTKTGASQEPHRVAAAARGDAFLRSVGSSIQRP